MCVKSRGKKQVIVFKFFLSFPEQVPHFSNLRSLDLSSCGLTGASAGPHMRRILEGLPKLKQLDLSGNDLGGELEDCLAVLKGESSCPKLEILVIVMYFYSTRATLTVFQLLFPTFFSAGPEELLIERG